MDGEPEASSDTATFCNLASASETQSDNNHAKLDTLEKKALHLRLVLEKDFFAADLKWSLFVAAAFSFRYESCLRPFPPIFQKDGVKDMDELLSVITDVPALDLFLKQLDDADNLAPLGDVLDLLFYVLVRLKEPTLKTVPVEALVAKLEEANGNERSEIIRSKHFQHDAILMNANSTLQAVKPQHIFQVVSSSKSIAEMKWKDTAKNHNVFYAFHGNRLENFYTLLNFGMKQHVNKNAQLGNGVYLSPELSVSLPYSHGGFGWGASCVGGHLSCVAMCEVIDAPEGINYQKVTPYEGDSSFEDGDKLKDEEDSVSGQNCQYLVTNSDLVRLRYLLVYVKQGPSRLPANRRRNSGGGFRQWLARHKLFSILLGYGLMLATIGFANNQPVHYYYKILMKKLDLAYNVKM